MPVQFTQIPASGLAAPIFTFEINAAGEGQAPSRFLILGHKVSGGAIAENTPFVISSREDLLVQAGAGSQLYEMGRLGRVAGPAAEIWGVAVPATGTAPVWTVTVNSVPATGGQATLEIAGRYVQTSLAAGGTAANLAAQLGAAINAYVDPLTLAYLPVTATVAGAVVTVTARHAGAAFGEIEIGAFTTVAGNILPGRITVANPTAAAGSPSISAALAALGDMPFDWIICPFDDDTNVGLLEAFLDEAGGRWGWSAQIYGHAFIMKTDSVSGLTTFADSHKDRHVSTLSRKACPTPSWEWLASEVLTHGRTLADPTGGTAAINQTGVVVPGVRAPRDGHDFGYAARNTLLQSGISTFGINVAGQVTIDKIVTMERFGASGEPSTTFRDVQAIACVMHGIRHIRNELIRRFSNKAAVDRNPYQLASQVTPQDVRAACITAYEDCVRFGLFENTERFARSLVVERDAGDPRRFNVGLNEVDLTNPLDVLAASTTIWAQTRA
jgi:phage tail sheath gpL-like